MTPLVNCLSFTWRKFRPHVLANSPAVCHPKVLNLGSRWVRLLAASNRRNVAFESDGWGSSTDILGEISGVGRVGTALRAKVVGLRLTSIYTHEMREATTQQHRTLTKKERATQRKLQLETCFKFAQLKIQRKHAHIT